MNNATKKQATGGPGEREGRHSPRIVTLDRQRQPVAFEQVVELGGKYRKTLGFFPLGAFQEHADKKNILVYLDAEGSVTGYIAFRITGTPRRVTIAHLCIREESRSQGIAGQLVAQLAKQTQDTLGIGLFCRPEYAANQVWPKLDFKPLGSKPGRSGDGTELLYWWRDNGHQTLFSQMFDLEYLDSAAVKAVLDANVLFDFDDVSREYHEESVGLLADWLAPLIVFSVSPEIDLEIHRQPDEMVKNRSHRRVQSIQRIPTNSDQIKALGEKIRLHMNWGTNGNSVSDSKHVAYASLQGFRYFITRDQGVLSTSKELEELTGVIAIRPSNFIMHFDELQREDQYRPAQVGDTKFRMRLLNETDSLFLYDHFRNHVSKELKKDFQQRMTKRLAQPNLHQNTLYETRGGSPLLLTSVTITTDAVNLEFFRTTKHPLLPLLTRYALQGTVMDAFARHKPLVTCSDPELSEQASAALGGLGFHRLEGQTYTKLTPRLIGEASEVAEGLRQLPLTSEKFREEIERMAASVEVAAEQPLELLPQVERLLWPAKILHDQLGNFVVPIKPRWANKLFDEGVPGLFSDAEHERLLLNWENVYYSRAARQGLLRPGSHILWYVSSERGFKVSAIRACSTVEEVVTGTARELHQRFKRLGVYKLKDLTEMTAASEKPLLAIRFTRTELFKHEIRNADFQANREELGGRRNQIQGPLRISNEEFRSLYLKGHGA